MGPDAALTLALPAAAALAGLLAALLTVVLWLRRASAQGRAPGRGHVPGEDRVSGVLAACRDAVVLHSPAGRVLGVNPAAARLFGLPPAEVVGRPLSDLPLRWVTGSGEPLTSQAVFDRRPVPTAVRLDAGSGSPPRADHAVAVGVTRAEGAMVRWTAVTTSRVPGARGGHDLLTTLVEVADPARADDAVTGAQVRAAMQHAAVGIAVLDLHGRVQTVNRCLATLLGMPVTALAGQELSAQSHPDDRAEEVDLLRRLLSGATDRLSTEKRYLRADGEIVWVVLDLALVLGGDGSGDHVVATVRDITDFRDHSEVLAHRAAHDPLTGLSNRALMQEVLQAAVARSRAAGDVAVLAIDLDEFKQINDRYGHGAGDDVLVRVATTLRAATAARGTAFRLGGDEFVIVVQHVDAARVAFEVAAAVHRGLQEPVHTNGRRLTARASVGIALAEHTIAEQGAAGLLAAADAALYRAKAAGRSRTEVYEAAMAVPGDPTQGTAADLESAMATGQVVLHYEPVVDLVTGTVAGHEAVVRWQHPERGLLLPAAFGAAARKAGLGPALSTHVVRQAVTRLADSTRGGGWVSVDVDTSLLADGHLTSALLAQLARSSVDPGRLVLELGDTGHDGSPTGVRQRVAELRAAGVATVLDCFGTGAAPLVSLRGLAVDGVKLDPSLVAGIPDDGAAVRVSKGLAALAREMDLVTIATGVSTQEQADGLRTAGWHYGQGWLFGAPGPDGDRLPDGVASRAQVLA